MKRLSSSKFFGLLQFEGWSWDYGSGYEHTFLKKDRKIHCYQSKDGGLFRIDFQPKGARFIDSEIIFSIISNINYDITETELISLIKLKYDKTFMNNLESFYDNNL